MTAIGKDRLLAARQEFRSFSLCKLEMICDGLDSVVDVFLTTI